LGEVEPRRLNLSVKTAEILGAIPLNKWVTSRDIALSTGYSPREIGATISYDLLNSFVERRPSNHSAWLYRRKSL